MTELEIQEAREWAQKYGPANCWTGSLGAAAVHIRKLVMSQKIFSGFSDCSTNTSKPIHPSVEWYTPLRCIQSARYVMGSIDVDPASCQHAQKTVQAKRFYTVNDNGLSKRWHGNIWLNPPYSGEFFRKFTQKLLAERDAGRLKNAIMLTLNNTDREWCHDLLNESDGVCITRGRIKFYREDGTFGSPPSGHLFFYFGKLVSLFKEEFSKYGFTIAL